jgi:hypothetical protein
MDQIDSMNNESWLDFNSINLAKYKQIMILSTWNEKMMKLGGKFLVLNNTCLKLNQLCKQNFGHMGIFQGKEIAN